VSEPAERANQSTRNRDPIAEFAPIFLAHINDDHADWALVVGRAFGNLPAAERAEVVDLDQHGVGIDVVADRVRVAFAEPVESTLQLQARGVALAVAARARSGDDTITSLEAQAAELAAIRTFITSVRRTQRITRNVREITFGGGDLETFSPGAPDQFLYVLAPPVGRRELTIDQGFTWEQYATMAPDEQPIGAYYTVRRWRREAAELDMLFVLHGDEGAASAWATAAGPGDPVALWGPRSAFDPPARTDWYLLVADDTGLPAVAAIIESLRPGSTVRVIAEVDSEDDCQPLPHVDGVGVQWCYRRGAPAGTTTLLVDAVRAMEWPPGTPYAWGGAESRCITAVRRHIRDERGLPLEAVSMTGYWRHAHHAADPD
jgi:NADPH-dependent ferric siderophore reductase